ncbi:unnamed protein product [Heterobilharzia americana]|nr:unnamed protein product [Heterobilharzia americana]
MCKTVKENGKTPIAPQLFLGSEYLGVRRYYFGCIGYTYTHMNMVYSVHYNVQNEKYFVSCIRRHIFY